MGNAAIRSLRPATNCEQDFLPTGLYHRTTEASGSNTEEHSQTELESNTENCAGAKAPIPKEKKRARVVSFQQEPSVHNWNASWIALRYHETVARIARNAWLKQTLPTVADVLNRAAQTSYQSQLHSRRKGPVRVRPLSRVSRRRWYQSTLASETQLLKTCWPVRQTEQLFLPVFPVDLSRDARYTDRVHLADGAFGRVFRVQESSATERSVSEPTTGNEVSQYALKVLHKSDIISSCAVGQLRDEVSIQKICGHHPFIVRCVDFWQTRTHIFLLSRYYKNGEIFQRIKTFSSELSRLYVAELALAIDFLHNAGIIYRDLKPENILLDENYHVKLIDFGFSKWLSPGNRTRTICGTAQYMAPEILQGEPYGHAVDWWALGVLACRMFAGQYPFADLTDHLRTLQEAGSDAYGTTLRPRALPPSTWKLPPALAARLPAAEHDLLQRMLHPDPQSRLRSLLGLQRIALYQHFRWEQVRNGTISPRQYLDERCLEPERPVEDAFPDF